ncbi:hypothetical protein [Fibrella aestuarina]|uniref:hypothetical protein n=1 Tax=Fibrella aestuarina TaxID=651143 RepID=UPI00059DE1D3|nr:hypothetical protein [Fibrella aestuarina]
MVERFVEFFQHYPLDVISHLFLFSPVCVFIYRRAFFDKALLCVCLYFLVHFLEETVLLYYVLHKQSTISIQKGLIAIDTLVIAELYYLALKENEISRQIGLALSLVTLFVTIVTYVYSQYSFIGASLFRLLLILFAIVYFNKILAENRILKIIHHPMFWISSAFLVFGMGTFMTSLFIDYLLDPAITSDKTFDLFWNMGQLLSVFQCVLVSIGFWVSKFDRGNYIQPL